MHGTYTTPLFVTYLGLDMLTLVGISPGRFFASNELKAMLAHIVSTYDVRLPPETGGVHPKPMWFNETLVPNMDASIEFRKRQS